MVSEALRGYHECFNGESEGRLWGSDEAGFECDEARRVFPVVWTKFYLYISTLND